MYISFEVFPPKKDGNFDTALDVVKTLSDYNPEFISVTYGAGGSKAGKTLSIASYIQSECKKQAVAHLTCVGSTRADILTRCREFEEHKIGHVLALRGDRPRDMDDAQFNNREFIYATDLIQFIKENTNLKVMAACYPEKHPQSTSVMQDIHIMKEKENLGAEEFLTQMFFDNEKFYSFMDLALKEGINSPVHAGIMPITKPEQLGTSISLSGSSVPKKLLDLFEKYGDNPLDMHKAGIDYATNQILELKEKGVYGVHIYTMNKPQTAFEILQNVK